MTVITGQRAPGRPDGTPVIMIRLLGRFAVDRDGQEIAVRAFGGRLARRLLRLLALRRGTLVPKDLIAVALWPEKPPADPAGNIEVLVSRIRRALGDRTLISTGQGGYVFADDDRCRVDAEAFLAAVRAGRAALAERPAEALASFRAALAIWRGEPLAEDAYADWAQPDRRQLSLAYLEALDGAATAALDSAGPAATAEAACWARQAQAAEPLRESSVLLLVRALAGVGDRAGALAAFDGYRDGLAAETGLEPTARAWQIRERVLAGQRASGRPRRHAAPAAAAPATAATTAGATTSVTAVTAVTTALPATGTVASGRAAGRRLAGLPARWREMLALLAVLGRPAPPALLAAATGADLRTVLDTLEGLGSAGLAGAGPRGWALSREQVRQSVGAALRPAETARSHALLAAGLRQCGAEPAETARHLAASGDNDEAAMAYAEAARRQLERICDAAALRLAEAGLSLDPPDRTRAALLETRGEARRRAGQLAGARADLAAALDGYDDPAARSRTLANLAILDARTADAARGGELAELAIAEARGQPAALGQALAAGAIIDLTQGNLARGRYRVRRAARLLDRAGDSCGSARLQYCRAMACFVDGRLRDAVTELGRLALLPVTPGELLRLWSPRATRGHALAILGHAGEGLAEIDETLDWARAAGHPAVAAECLWHRAETLAALGRAAAAIGSAEESAAIATRIGHAEWTAAARRGLGVACEAAGLAGRAESAYRGSLLAGRDIPFFRAWAAARLGAFLARRGRPADAAPYVTAALTAGTPLTRHEARWAHAELLASQGDGDACREAAAAALDQALGGGYLILVPRLRELAGR